MNASRLVYKIIFHRTTNIPIPKRSITQDSDEAHPLFPVPLSFERIRLIAPSAAHISTPECKSADRHPPIRMILAVIRPMHGTGLTRA